MASRIVGLGIVLAATLKSTAGFALPRYFGRGRLQRLQLAAASDPHQDVPLTSHDADLDWRGDCPPPFYLGEERDACGVGFIARENGEASRDIVVKGLEALECMEHRGGCLADTLSGDGAGIMTNVPWKLLRDVVSEEEQSRAGVGMFFMPTDKTQRAMIQAALDDLFMRNKVDVLGWRDVPTDPEVLGPESRANLPHITQVVVKSAERGKALERQLYLLRRRIEPEMRSMNIPGAASFYVCSFSGRTIVYKGMMRSPSLKYFYLDLLDESFESSFAVYHRRFSTNTSPKWRLAQPMRMLGHNGEINTLLGNINWQISRERNLALEGEDLFFTNEEDNFEAVPGPQRDAQSSKVCDTGDLWDPENTHRLVNVCDLSDGQEFEDTVSSAFSDSANLDSVMEMLVRSGKPPAEAVMMLVPEAYEMKAKHAPAVQDFYRYYEGLHEPWDGPALLVFSDGITVGAKLDRNGLRPARFVRTKNGLVAFMSETGVFTLDEDDAVIERGRLGPGEMVAVNIRDHSFGKNWDIKDKVAARFPYGEWLRNQAVHLPLVAYPQSSEFPAFSTEEDGAPDHRPLNSMVRTQTLFGWGAEDVDLQLSAMANTGKEATFCMGDDAPLAVLSSKPHVLYDYFKQRFAQITNPAIDPLREGMVMSLNMALGRKGNSLQPTEENARLLHITSPILHEGDLRSILDSEFPNEVLDTSYALADGPGGLEETVQRICDDAVAAVRSGTEILVLSDAALLEQEHLGKRTYVPPLLAVGAVHHRLITEGLRMRASIISETGQAWSTHHMACLVGFGASAVHPYLAHEAVRESVRNQVRKDDSITLTEEKALGNFRTALDAGILKILSKMGIGTLSSYMGAQIFEAIGLSKEVMDVGFRGTPSRVGGLTLTEVAEEVAMFYARAFPDVLNEGSESRKRLENYGYVKFVPRAEFHHNSPGLSKTLHKAVRAASTGDYATGVDHYRLFMAALEERPATTLRDLLRLSPPATPLPLEKVESAEAIMARFCTGGMSLGALSREAHETLAIAMNRIGGKSNSGEGGEDPNRWLPLTPEDLDEGGHCTTGKVSPLLKNLKVGDVAAAAIKQVASGRFGVTPQYLRSGSQLEIKVAQGAKPGEGGQLPGSKIDEYIANLRSSTPGVTLISPPPHHDIYSIEDLAQLIYDLKMVHPEAGVSVKLVAEVGIGTVACGVAKANADIIQISGHDGGTGASPLSSIKHAGSPWELGLTEVHQSLVENGLRDKVTLRVDGGIKSGWDVVVGAALGAEEFGFGTIAMIAEGCVMARVCHLNTCPVGVTTQRMDLREKFPGDAEHVVQYFRMVAEETRSILATLGMRSLKELVGQLGVLEVKESTGAKTANLDPKVLLRGAVSGGGTHREEKAHHVADGHPEVGGPPKTLDDELLELEEVQELLAGKEDAAVTLKRPVGNTDRTVGGRVCGEMAAALGGGGIAALGSSLKVVLTGTAGQSFGAFNMPGVHLVVEGGANDYVGKSMHGGSLEVRGKGMEGRADGGVPVLVGNTVLYGATGGSLYVRGAAGERFGVRNSGALGVVEGVGDHLGEYQTGGTLVVLGTAGQNVGSGMTGGVLFLCGDGELNDEYVEGFGVRAGSAAANALRRIVEDQAQRVGSDMAEGMLANWDAALSKVREVRPKGTESLFMDVVVEAELREGVKQR